MDTYKDLHGTIHVDLTLDQYKADLKEAFIDSLDTAYSLTLGGVQTSPEDAFEKFFILHKNRRKIQRGKLTVNNISPKFPLPVVLVAKQKGQKSIKEHYPLQVQNRLIQKIR